MSRASGSSALSQRLPIDRRRRAAAGALDPEALLIEWRVLDRDVLPVDVEFVRDDHRQVHLRALTALGILAEDDDFAISVDFQKRPRLVGGAACRCAAPFLPEHGRWIEIDGDHQATARESGGAEEGAALHR